MAHRTISSFDSSVRPVASVAVAVVAIALAAGGAWWLLRPASPPVESTLPLASPTSTTLASTTSSTPDSETELVVQAAGSVARPGLYRLPPGSRVDDLVREAGGLGGDADADRVNLAAPVADGERVWIPRQGEETVPEVVAGGGTPGGGVGGGQPGTSPGTPVDLNSATAEELDALPGIGPATATAILSHREQEGPFASVDDLLDVRGIGEAKLEQLRPLVRV